MYQHAWLQASRALFRIDIEAKLKDLLHLDFEDGALANFKTAMIHGAGQLVSQGHKTYKQSESSIAFMTQSVTVILETPHDEWEYRLYPLAKTVGVNSGVLAMAPWEKLIFDKSTMASIPTYAKLAPDLIAKISCARDAITEALGSKPQTIREMIRLVNASARIFVQLDRTIQCELAFLNDRAEAMIVAIVQHRILSTLPSDTHQCTIQQEKSRTNIRCILYGCDICLYINIVSVFPCHIYRYL